MADTRGPPTSYGAKPPTSSGAEPSDGPAASHGPQPSGGPQPSPGPQPSHAQVVLRAPPGSITYCLQQCEAVLWLAIRENHNAQCMFQDSGTA